MRYDVLELRIRLPSHDFLAIYADARYSKRFLVRVGKKRHAFFSCTRQRLDRRRYPATFETALPGRHSRADRPQFDVEMSLGFRLGA